MQPFRALLLRHRVLAMLLVLATLCLKAALPSGYMIDRSAGASVTVVLCHGGDATAKPATLTIQRHLPAGDSKTAGQAQDSACPYSSLSQALMGGIPPLLLAAAIAFLLVLGFAPVRTVLIRRGAFFVPPLRAPPALV